MTTTRVTHATPAAAYAHSADRSWEASIPDDIPEREKCGKDIAAQLVDDNAHINVSRNFFVFHLQNI